eukprot:958705-Prymnesium_polylepis.2
MIPKDLYALLKKYNTSLTKSLKQAAKDSPAPFGVESAEMKNYNSHLKPDYSVWVKTWSQLTKMVLEDDSYVNDATLNLEDLKSSKGKGAKEILEIKSKISMVEAEAAIFDGPFFKAAVQSNRFKRMFEHYLKECLKEYFEVGKIDIEFVHDKMRIKNKQAWIILQQCIEEMIKRHAKMALSFARKPDVPFDRFFDRKKQEDKRKYLTQQEVSIDPEWNDMDIRAEAEKLYTKKKAKLCKTRLYAEHWDKARDFSDFPRFTFHQ